MSDLPFEYDRNVVEGYVTVTCPDREYGIKRIHVPNDFWPEGKYLLTRLWGQKNPKIFTDGTFQEIGGIVTFHFAPCTVNAGKIMNIVKTLVNPVYSASRSIKCLVDWPEMSQWKKSNAANSQNRGGDSPLDVISPVNFMIGAIQRGELEAIPFGDGNMITNDSAELDYLAHCS